MYRGGCIWRHHFTTTPLVEKKYGQRHKRPYTGLGQSPSEFLLWSIGTIVHYNGKDWSQMQSNTTGYFSSVWGSPVRCLRGIWRQFSFSIMMVNMECHVYKRSGNPSVFVSNIWELSSSDIFTVGSAARSCTTTAMPGVS